MKIGCPFPEKSPKNCSFEVGEKLLRKCIVFEVKFRKLQQGIGKKRNWFEEPVLFLRGGARTGIASSI